MKVCAQCKFKDTCEGLPGFCLMIPYVIIAGIVAMLIYFMFTSSL